MAENDTPPSDSSDSQGETSSDYTAGLWSAFTGGLQTGIGNYLGALGNRQDSFGQTKPAGAGNPAVQYTRNPLTGELINNSTGRPVGGMPGGLPGWVIPAGGVLALAVAMFLVFRR